MRFKSVTVIILIILVVMVILTRDMAIARASTASGGPHAGTSDLSTAICDSVTDVAKSECLALIALYNSTDGDNWGYAGNWGVTTTVGNWYGVSVSGGHVTDLILGDNWLSGSISHAIGDLTNLWYLSLSNNQLTGSIPSELGSLSNLAYLDLSYNQLSGSIPPELGSLSNLLDLELRSNALTGNVPPELGNLTSLQNLFLNINQLSGGIPSELGNLTNLERLWIFNNQLSGSIPPELGNLANLQELYLSNNQLSGSIPPELGNLANLVNLSITGSISTPGMLTGSIPPELGNLTSLENISLYNNQLSGGIPPELGNLANLQYLNLASNQLSGSIPSELVALANLRSLQLQSNLLSGSIPPQLGNLTNLQTLYLTLNQLSGSIPPELGNLVNLQTLLLGINNLSGSIPSAIGSLTNLQQLDLGNNALSGEVPVTITNLTKLTYLNIHYNGLVATDLAVRAFLDAKAPGWQTTQTIDVNMDSDGDGLPDIWEMQGIDDDGDGVPEVDLPAMGADPYKKDVFVEVDWMEQTDGFTAHSHKPDPEAIEIVVQAFANAPVDGGKGINLHVDVGPDSIDLVTGRAWGSLSRGNSLAHDDELGNASSPKEPALRDEWSQLAEHHFGHDSRVFHYSLFVHHVVASDLPKCTSGLGKPQYFIVALGGYSPCPLIPWGTGSVHEQAGTFMHELGHSLGLKHGGSDGVNYKPNYLSVMNYSFQMSGLIKDGTDRHYDYSRFELPPMNEASLSETLGLNDPRVANYGTKYHINAPRLCIPNDRNGLNIADHANGPVDWNCNLLIQENPVQADVNGDGTISPTFNSFNDWENLQFKINGIGRTGAPLQSGIPIGALADIEPELTYEEDSRIPRVSDIRVQLSTTAQPAFVTPGDVVAYTIRLQNIDVGTAEGVVITDTLPDGFAYKTGSTTGAVSSDPAVSGQALTWEPLAVPGHGGELVITFEAVSSGQPGIYFNNVSGTSTTGTVLPTGDSAAVHVAAYRLSVPSLTSPRDHVNITDTTPTLRWRNIRGAVRYHLQFADTPDFSSLLVDDRNLTRPNYTIPESGSVEYKTYYWRVMAWDTAGNWSGWSTVNTFTVTLLKTPKDGDFTKDTTPAFRWAGVRGAARYWLQVSTDAGFTNLLVDEDSLTRVAFTPADALPFGPFYWRVQVDLGGGFTDNWTPTWTSTVTPSVPVRPVLESPASGTLTASAPDQLTWQPLADGATYRYQVQLDDQANFRSPLQDATLDPDVTTYVPAPLSENGRVFWRVRAINEHGVAGQWSAVWWFRLDALPRPVLTAPAHRSTTASPGPTFEWDAVPDAAEYQVQISPDRRFGTVEQATTVAGTTYSADALPDGVFFWRVRGVNAAGIAGTWSAVWQITIDSDGPDALVLSVPKQGGATPDTTPRLAWKASRGAVEYRVQVDDDPAFGSPLEWDGLTRPYLAVPEAEALPHGVYHWRVQGRDARDVWGAWSQTGTFIVTVHKSPADGAAMTNTRPTFRWAAVAGASYRVQLSTNPDIDADPSLLVDEVRSTTSYRPPAALSYGTVYWRVSLDDGVSWMPTWVVTITPRPPARVGLSTPKNRSLTTDSTPTLMWKAAVRGETYQVQIDDDRRFGSPAQDVTLGVGVLAYTADALPDGIYFWRVRALNAFDAPGSWSAAWRMEVDTVAPEVPALVAPEDGARVTNRVLRLEWSRVSDAVRYEVQLDPDPAFPLPPSDAARRTTYALPTTIAQNVYYWRARAVDKAGNVSAWSEPRSFSLVAGNTALSAPAVVPVLGESLVMVEAEGARVTPGGTWTVKADAAASGGAYALSSGEPGDVLEMAFSGTRLDVVYVQGPALGTFAVEVDGAVLLTVNSGVGEGYSTAWAMLPDLAPGTHTLRIVPVKGAVAVDGFVVEQQ